jgi:hypothetical protein
LQGAEDFGSGVDDLTFDQGDIATNFRIAPESGSLRVPIAGQAAALDGFHFRKGRHRLASSRCDMDVLDVGQYCRAARRQPFAQADAALTAET